MGTGTAGRGRYETGPNFVKTERGGAGRAFEVLGSGRFQKYRNRGYPDRPICITMDERDLRYHLSIQSQSLVSTLANSTSRVPELPSVSQTLTLPVPSIDSNSQTLTHIHSAHCLPPSGPTQQHHLRRRDPTTITPSPPSSSNSQTLTAPSRPTQPHHLRRRDHTTVEEHCYHQWSSTTTNHHPSKILVILN